MASTESTKRRLEFRKYAVEDVAGIAERLRESVLDEKGEPTKAVEDKQAEDLVSCIELLLLYGLKGRYASRGSYWDLIQAISKARRDAHNFKKDFAFCSRLYFEKDRDKIERGRAFIRHCLNAQRLGEALRVIASTPRTISRWVHPHAVWASSQDVNIVLSAIKQMSKLKFELQMYHPVRYKWKIVDGYPARVYCQPRPPPVPRGKKLRKNKMKQRNNRRAEGVLASLFDEQEKKRRRGKVTMPSNGHWSVHSTTPWIAYTDENSGCMYFYNAVTNQSSWEEPAEGYVTHESAVEPSPWFLTVNNGINKNNANEDKQHPGDLKGDSSDVGAVQVEISPPPSDQEGRGGGGGGAGGAGGANGRTVGGLAPLKTDGLHKHSPTPSPTNESTPWVRFVDETTGCTYYFNAVTGETTWDEPKEGFATDESALEWQKASRSPTLLTPLIRSPAGSMDKPSNPLDEEKTNS